MRRFLDVCGPSQHLPGGMIIVIDPGGQTATSRAYVQARHQRADDANGEYVGRWGSRSQGWRIARRNAVWQSHGGDPAIIWSSR